MTDLLVLQGHPNRSSFVAALAAAYADAARREGVGVRTIHLADLTFDLVLHGGHAEPQPLESDLGEALAAIREASHVTFAFPTWWAGPPALVKGFVDRVFLPGVAFRFEPGKSLPTGLLRGRSARMITTMDSPSPWYWWKHGRSNHRWFVDATLDFCGFGPIDTRTIYSVRTLDEAGRREAIDRAARDGTRDARALVRRRSRQGDVRSLAAPNAG